MVAVSEGQVVESVESVEGRSGSRLGVSVIRTLRERRRLTLAARALASVGLLGFLLTRVHLASLVPDWDHAAVAWLLGGLALTLVGIVLATLRWQRVLKALELPSRLRTLLSHQLAGLFVGNVAPSTMGVDVLRVFRLSVGTGESERSFASVVLERLSGWVVLPLMTLAALLIDPSLLHLGIATRVAVTISLGTLAVLVLAMVLASHPRVGGRLVHNGGWLRFLGAVHLGLQRFRRQPGAAASVLVTGLAYQAAVVTAAWMGAHAMGIRLGWVTFLAFFPAVAIAQVLSPVGGLGLREGALVVFLSRSPLRVPEAQAIALGLLVYGMNLTASLLGAPAFAVGARPARTAA